MCIRDRPGGALHPLGLQGVGADELGKAGVLVGGGVFLRLHLAEEHPLPPVCDLQGRLTAGQTGADDPDHSARSSRS